MIVGVAFASLAASAGAQTPTLTIGYIPSSTPGEVVIKLSAWAGGCDGNVGCLLFVGDAGRLTADATNAAEVMAALDDVIQNESCFGYTMFGPPVDVPGIAPGEIRHEYPLQPDTEGGLSHIMTAIVQFNRGAMSLSLRDPCGPYLSAGITGPYYVAVRGVPEAAGNLVVHCSGKPTVEVAIDSADTPQVIADALLFEAVAAGIHAASLDATTVGFNVTRFDQDVSGLEYVGMADASSMPLEIGNRLDLWVQIESSTWGRVKAIYR